jgi:hypothetical protein
MPQFMPSSFARWAVDFDADGRIDLARSPADVIGSVANYFKSYGWQTGMPTHYPVSFDPARLDKEALLAPDILPTFSVASFTAKGAVLEGAALQHQGPLALVELQNGEAQPQYVAGTENFYVITRYNWSSYYAMAVIELGQEVKRAVAAQAEAMAAPIPAPPAAPLDLSAPPVAPVDVSAPPAAPEESAAPREASRGSGASPAAADAASPDAPAGSTKPVDVPAAPAAPADVTRPAEAPPAPPAPPAPSS